MSTPNRSFVGIPKMRHCSLGVKLADQSILNPISGKLDISGQAGSPVLLSVDPTNPEECLAEDLEFWSIFNNDSVFAEGTLTP